MATPLPASDEAARQRSLDSYHVIDTLPEAAYDDIVHLASTLCATPAALVTLIDRDRQWFKAKLGLDDAQTSRDVALCDHAIRTPDKLFEVPDLGHDPRFSANPYVDGTAGAARFYAGMPLVTPEGAAIGTVCVLDHRPRRLEPAQRAALESLARLTMALLNARRRERALEHQAFVAEAAPPAAAGPGESPAGAPYLLALFELQDHAGTVARLGERATEKLLQALDAELEQSLAPGDAVNRSSGDVEYVAVLHGEHRDRALQRLHDTMARQPHERGLHFLAGTAAGNGREAPTAVFLRADADLLARKPVDA